MSFSNYGELKTAVAARLSRSNMTSLLPDFIAIAHRTMMRGRKEVRTGQWIVPPLRIRDMLETAQLTPADGAADLPDGYLGMKSLTTSTSGAPPLSYRPPADFRGSGLFVSSGVPEFYTIEADQVLIAPFDTNVLTCLFYEEIDPPSADGDTNAIFTVVPEAYLYGAIAEAYDHIRQHDRAEKYLAQFAGVVMAANGQTDEALVSGAPLVMRPTRTV